MFTGIVEEVGTLVVREEQTDAARMEIRARKVLEDVALGDSISVNGVCLTVTSVQDGVWSTDVMAETLRRSSLGKTEEGSRVNLERAVTAHTRLGGHMVQGHVDGVGNVLTREPSTHWEVFRIALPAGLAQYVVEKGSITVDGVSLTVAGLNGDSFDVALIPHTLEVTTMGALAPASPVNLEVDILAKSVERLMTETPR